MAKYEKRFTVCSDGVELLHSRLGKRGRIEFRVSVHPRLIPLGWEFRRDIATVRFDKEEQVPVILFHREPDDLITKQRVGTETYVDAESPDPKSPKSPHGASTSGYWWEATGHEGEMKVIVTRYGGEKSNHDVIVSLKRRGDGCFNGKYSVSTIKSDFVPSIKCSVKKHKVACEVWIKEQGAK